MLVSPCVYFKLVLSLFEAAGVSYFASENDACAVHEIEHDIFKFWHEFFVVDNIVVDLVVGRYVDSDVAFDIVDESPGVNFMEFFPDQVLELVWFLAQKDYL